MHYLKKITEGPFTIMKTKLLEDFLNYGQV